MSRTKSVTRFIIPAASQEHAGLARFATAAEAADLASTTVALSPATIGNTLSGSLADSGWCRLPNGLILQWGSFPALASDARTVTLPVAYPNAALYCGHTHSLAASGYTPKSGFASLSQLQLGADFWTAGTNPTVTHYWFALGN